MSDSWSCSTVPAGPMGALGSMVRGGEKGIGVTADNLKLPAASQKHLATHLFVLEPNVTESILHLHILQTNRTRDFALEFQVLHGLHDPCLHLSLSRDWPLRIVDRDLEECSPYIRCPGFLNHVLKPRLVKHALYFFLSFTLSSIPPAPNYQLKLCLQVSGRASCTRGHIWPPPLRRSATFPYMQQATSSSTRTLF